MLITALCHQWNGGCVNLPREQIHVEQIHVQHIEQIHVQHIERVLVRVRVLVLHIDFRLKTCTFITFTWSSLSDL